MKPESGARGSVSSPLFESTEDPEDRDRAHGLDDRALHPKGVLFRITCRDRGGVPPPAARPLLSPRPHHVRRAALFVGHDRSLDVGFDESRRRVRSWLRAEIALAGEAREGGREPRIVEPPRGRALSASAGS